MIHRYNVDFDSEGYIQGFYVPYEEEMGQYEFDGSTLELDFLHAYKIEHNIPVLDQQRKAEIIAEREHEQSLPTDMDKLQAQTYYTAVMTDTLLVEE